MSPSGERDPGYPFGGVSWEENEDQGPGTLARYRHGTVLLRSGQRPRRASYRPKGSEHRPTPRAAPARSTFGLAQQARCSCREPGRSESVRPWRRGGQAPGVARTSDRAGIAGDRRAAPLASSPQGYGDTVSPKLIGGSEKNPCICKDLGLNGGDGGSLQPLCLSCYKSKIF
jgi:hypothetical protein